MAVRIVLLFVRARFSAWESASSEGRVGCSAAAETAASARSTGKRVIARRILNLGDQLLFFWYRKLDLLTFEAGCGPGRAVWGRLAEVERNLAVNDSEMELPSQLLIEFTRVRLPDLVFF